MDAGVEETGLLSTIPMTYVCDGDTWTCSETGFILRCYAMQCQHTFFHLAIAAPNLM